MAYLPNQGEGRGVVTFDELAQTLRVSETLRVSKEFAKHDEIIARRIEVVDHCFVAVAAGFIQPTGRGIGRCA